MTAKTSLKLLVIPVLLSIGILSNMSLAFAGSDCSTFFDPKCLGTEELDSTVSFDQSGIKATVDIPNITTSSTCAPSGTGFGVVSTWAFFPNGDWLGIGVASGQIDGTCYDSEEHHYLEYSQDSSYSEFKLANPPSPGNDIVYEVSDTNNDSTWKAYVGASEAASLIFDFDYASTAITGLEAIDDDISVPKTSITNISKHDGSSWSFWTTHDDIQNTGAGWIEQCTPNHKNIAVGVGGTESC